MSCSCGCATDRDLADERRMARALALLGVEEVTCPNMDLRPGETHRSGCRIECELCGGDWKVPVRIAKTRARRQARKG